MFRFTKTSILCAQIDCKFYKKDTQEMLKGEHDLEAVFLYTV